MLQSKIKNEYVVEKNNEKNCFQLFLKFYNLKTIMLRKCKRPETDLYTLLPPKRQEQILIFLRRK